MHLVAPLEDALDLALVEPASDCGGQARFIERPHPVPELGVDLNELVAKTVARKRACDRSESGSRRDGVVRADRGSRSSAVIDRPAARPGSIH
jgi:hypothetical protein